MEIHQTGDFFEAVQLLPVFPDSKTFPDCTPKRDLATIVSDYQTERNKPDFSLPDFVNRNFQTPETHSTGFESNTNTSVTAHIEKLWDVLTRKPDEAQSSLIPLPNSYIVPGGRFGEIYYWDSYFTMLGLRQSKRVDLMENMVKNFAHLIDRQGYIPNGNRTYYTGRSQPPFFTLMVKLLGEVSKDKPILLNYLQQVEKEYRFWMNGIEQLTPEKNALKRVVMLKDGSILNRFWDENDTPRPEAYKEDVELAHHSSAKSELYRHIRAAAESGWDFSSRWFSDPNKFSSIHTTDIIPVDLNCLLADVENTLSDIYSHLNQSAKANSYKAAGERRINAIKKHCWNESSSFFFDFDFIQNKTTSSLTLAGAFPLFFSIASDEQAHKVANTIKEEFLKPGGVTTTIQKTGQQWDAPNGWAPLQWITFAGLKNYKQHELADVIKSNWLNTCERVYRETGKMMEKYDVFGSGDVGGGGEYPNQDGFGWTNGVYLAMKNA
ncbi:MAG: alpha,alpha-trehalase TreF [Cyclobacteriaceae bacterium]|nr:alpha,alpha-trehalase TreF [Cyclobacteriaceae bacterium]